MHDVSEKIKQYRKKHELTQAQLAQKLHVTKQAVSKWETGRGFPDTSMIPVLAKELGVSIDSFMGNTVVKKKITVKTVLFLLLLLGVFISVPIIITNLSNKSDYIRLKNSIEDQIGIDLPDNGEVVLADFSEWKQFGNSVLVNSMSYFVFEEYSQTEEFEKLLREDIHWVTNISPTLLDQIPTNLHSYTTDGDYYMIYNVTTNTFNEDDISSGMYNYLFIVYQKDNNRFIIFEYTKEFE